MLSTVVSVCWQTDRYRSSRLGSISRQRQRARGVIIFKRRGEEYLIFSIFFAAHPSSRSRSNIYSYIIFGVGVLTSILSHIPVSISPFHWCCHSYPCSIPALVKEFSINEADLQDRICAISGNEILWVCVVRHGGGIAAVYIPFCTNSSRARS